MERRHVASRKRIATHGRSNDRLRYLADGIITARPDGLTIADAMLDRLMQRHHRITLTGESLRKTSPKPNVPEPELDQN
ncbi:hypothetical protein BC2230_70006 [Burkholderia cepacia]